MDEPRQAVRRRHGNQLQPNHQPEGEQERTRPRRRKVRHLSRHGQGHRCRRQRTAHPLDDVDRSVGDGEIFFGDRGIRRRHRRDVDHTLARAGDEKTDHRQGGRKLPKDHPDEGQHAKKCQQRATSRDRATAKAVSQFAAYGKLAHHPDSHRRDHAASLVGGQCAARDQIQRH